MYRGRLVHSVLLNAKQNANTNYDTNTNKKPAAHFNTRPCLV